MSTSCILRLWAYALRITSLLFIEVIIKRVTAPPTPTAQTPTPPLPNTVTAAVHGTFPPAPSGIAAIAA